MSFRRICLVLGTFDFQYTKIIQIHNLEAAARKSENLNDISDGGIKSFFF